MAADLPCDLNVLMYLRKSRVDVEAEKRGEGDVLKKHRAILLEFAKRYRHNVIDILSEVKSGERISNRPKIQRALRAVEEGHYNGITVNGVLCMDIDRLGRGDMIDQGIILATFKYSSALILTPYKVYDLNDEMDEEWSEYKAYQARQELKFITRRLQRGRISSVKEGRYIGTRPPFGYDKDKINSLVPNKNADIVKLIFYWYVHGDENGDPMGSTKIKDRLNGMGIKSYLKGQAWEPSTVLSLLKNEVYIGRIQWKKKFRDRARHIGRARPREEWIDVKGKHEPIIDKELFEAAQKKIENNHVIPTRKEPKNPLAGLIVCGRCGSRMILQGGRGGRVRMVKCIRSGCDNKSSSFHFVEERMLQAVRNQLAKMNLDQQELSLEAAGDSIPALPPSVLTDIENRLAELQKQRGRLHDLLEQGAYDIPTYLERSRVIAVKIEDSQNSLKKVRQEIARDQAREQDRLKTIPTVKHVLDMYGSTKSVVRKNDLLKSVIEKVVYKKEKSAKLDDFALEVHLLI